MPTAVVALIESFDELSPGVQVSTQRLNAILQAVSDAHSMPGGQGAYVVGGSMHCGSEHNVVFQRVESPKTPLRLIVQKAGVDIFVRLYEWSTDGVLSAIVDAKAAVANDRRRVQCCRRFMTALGMPKCATCMLEAAVEHSKTEELIPGVRATDYRLNILLSALLNCDEDGLRVGGVHFACANDGNKMLLTVELPYEVYEWCPRGLMQAIGDQRLRVYYVADERVECPECDGSMPTYWAACMPKCPDCFLEEVFSAAPSSELIPGVAATEERLGAILTLAHGIELDIDDLDLVGGTAEVPEHGFDLGRSGGRLTVVVTHKCNADGYLEAPTLFQSHYPWSTEGVMAAIQEVREAIVSDGVRVACRVCSMEGAQIPAALGMQECVRCALTIALGL